MNWPIILRKEGDTLMRFKDGSEGVREEVPISCFVGCFGMVAVGEEAGDWLASVA